MHRDIWLLEPKDMLMLLTAVSEAVERYEPEREAVLLLEGEKGFEVSIISARGAQSVGGLFYDPKDGSRSDP